MQDDLPTLTELKLAYVQCKTYGHSWDEFRSTSSACDSVYTAGSGSRPGTCHRYDQISPVSGELEGRSYDRPPGFRTARISRPDLRVELLRRLKKARRG